MRRALIVSIFVVATLLTVTALAAPAGLGLSWWTIDGGGGTSAGGGYTLSGTIGQSDAGTLSGGAYTLQSGFWDTPHSVSYIPLVFK